MSFFCAKTFVLLNSETMCSLYAVSGNLCFAGGTRSGQIPLQNVPKKIKSLEIQHIFKTIRFRGTTVDRHCSSACFTSFIMPWNHFHRFTSNYKINEDFCASSSSVCATVKDKKYLDGVSLKYVLKHSELNLN